jgi:hypothetical protein
MPCSAKLTACTATALFSLFFRGTFVIFAANVAAYLRITPESPPGQYKEANISAKFTPMLQERLLHYLKT